VFDREFKAAAGLSPKHNDELLAYFESDSYQEYIEENEDRISIIITMVIGLYEPIGQYLGPKASSTPIINNLRHLRHRYAHDQMTSPVEHIKGFSRELKSGKYTIDEWAEYVQSVISEVQDHDGVDQINTMLLHRTPEELLDHAAMTSEKMEIHRADLESTLVFLNEEDEWNTYTEVYDANNRVAIQRLTELLNPEKPNLVVQIWGEGGLGKTALMREYIRRNVRLSNPEDLFDRYLLFSSKSRTQGEVETTPSGTTEFGTIDPTYGNHGPVRFVENLAFVEFLRLIAVYARCSENELDVALALEQNKFLVVLDNFEDCKDKLDFIRFFERLKAGCKSRIIITGRKEEFANDLPTIQLDYMSSESASKLLWERYLFLMKNHSEEGVWEHREPIYTALQHLRNKEVDFIHDLTNELEAKPERRGSLDPAVFRNRIGHPLVVLRLAVEIGRPTLKISFPKDIGESERVLATLSTIVQSNGFQDWTDKVSKWVTDKAYEDIANDRECVLILNRLLNASASMAELKKHVSEQKGDVTRVPEATRRLLSHQILIRRRKSDDRYEAAEQAKAHLASGTTEQDDGQQHATTSVADAIEKQLDSILGELGDFESTPSETTVSLVINAKVPLHKRVTITRQSLGLIRSILTCVRSHHPPYVQKMVDAFGLLASSMLQKEHTDRKLLASILVRTLVINPPTPEAFAERLESLQPGDLRDVDQNFQAMLSQAILLLIEGTDDTTSLDIPLLLNSLGDCNGRYTLLINDLKVAWDRIKKHPQVAPKSLDDDTQEYPRTNLTPDAKAILSRMAQNDKGWNQRSASILCFYEAEKISETWEGISNWERYAVPPHAPPEAVLEDLQIDGDFSPGINGISYAGSSSEKHYFVAVERPIVHPDHAGERPIATRGHPAIITATDRATTQIREQKDTPENTESLNHQVMRWLSEQLDERPNELHATALMTFLSQTYNQRPTDLIPRISEGKYSTWIQWFESDILTQPKFKLYHLTRPTGTHVVIATKKLPTGVRSWLFHAGPLSPHLPQPLRAAEILLNDHFGLSLEKKHLHDNGQFLHHLQSAKDRLSISQINVDSARDVLEYLVRKQADQADLKESERKEIRIIFDEWFEKLIHIFQNKIKSYKAKQTPLQRDDLTKRKAQKSEYADKMKRIAPRRGARVARRLFEEE
jgi:hypothetical protein